MTQMEVFSSLALSFPSLNSYALHTVYLAASIGTGIATSKLVEIPILKLRERFFPSRTFGVATVLEPAPPSKQPPALETALADSRSNPEVG